MFCFTVERKIEMFLGLDVDVRGHNVLLLDEP